MNSTTPPVSARSAPGGPLVPPQRPGLVRLAWAALIGTGRGRILLAALAAYLLFQAWLSLMVPGKIAEGFDPDRPRLNLLVTLSFPPERFHVLFFQRHGRVSGTDGNTIEVRGVPRAKMAQVARPYWVRRVEPLQD